MGNFNEAVRAMPPPRNTILCDQCGQQVPLVGDDWHTVRLDPLGDVQTITVECRVSVS